MKAADATTIRQSKTAIPERTSLWPCFRNDVTGRVGTNKITIGFISMRQMTHREQIQPGGKLDLPCPCATLRQIT